MDVKQSTVKQTKDVQNIVEETKMKKDTKTAFQKTDIKYLCDLGKPNNYSIEDHNYERFMELFLKNFTEELFQEDNQDALVELYLLLTKKE